ncbi:hypothetical protein XA26_31930 [Mycolicibacterium fortuitum]|uniref:Uncharacterized protein n=1 Tax=Mycolicibacterium fortuitum TaxID=1766 RepID=A0A0N7H8S3_MYCFO|nr:hypothetical protein XA26_31930 [Mycolicibacterium fortuitum]
MTRLRTRWSIIRWPRAPRAETIFPGLGNGPRLQRADYGSVMTYGEQWAALCVSKMVIGPGGAP